MMKTHSSPPRRGRSEGLQSGFSYHVLSSGLVFSHELRIKLLFRVKEGSTRSAARVGLLEHYDVSRIENSLASHI
jgi:hypothetical protein